MKESVQQLKDRVILWLKRQPVWIYFAIGLLTLFWAKIMLGKYEAQFLLLDDQSVVLDYDERFGSSKRYHIQWKDGRWVEHGTEKPAEVGLIQDDYGTASIKLSMTAIQLARSKPSISVWGLDSEGERFFKETFFLKDGDWWATNSDMSESLPLVEYQFKLYGLSD